jgi:hypothetical protein
MILLGSAVLTLLALWLAVVTLIKEARAFNCLMRINSHVEFILDVRPGIPGSQINPRTYLHAKRIHEEIEEFLKK